MPNSFAIAIDGPAGAGKSTIAKAVSRETGALYLDTGAMYRAVGLYMIRIGVDPADEAGVAARVDDVDIDVRHVDGTQRIFLGGEDVSERIRESDISDASSKVSRVPAVRVKLVAMQRGIASGRGVVMDGRDIGTKVLPNAELKIFLVADVGERARRRCLELEEKGVPEPYEKVLADMIERDRNDSTRKESPLCKAADAIELDTSRLSREEVVAAVLDLWGRRRRELKI